MAVELISDLLRGGLVVLDIQTEEKDEAIRELVDVLVSRGGVTDRDGLLRDVMQREELESTGLGRGVGLPHCRSAHVARIGLVFGRPAQPIEYGALDGAPVSLLFLVVSPSACESDYIKILARLSRLLRREGFRDALLKARSPDEVVQLFAAEGA